MLPCRLTACVRASVGSLTTKRRAASPTGHFHSQVLRLTSTHNIGACTPNRPHRASPRQRARTGLPNTGRSHGLSRHSSRVWYSIYRRPCFNSDSRTRCARMSDVNSARGTDSFAPRCFNFPTPVRSNIPLHPLASTLRIALRSSPKNSRMAFLTPIPSEITLHRTTHPGCTEDIATLAWALLQWQVVPPLR